MLAEAVLCLALNVFFEARGESLVGQKAVAHVTLNRAKHDPRKVCSVVFAPNQFSWTRKVSRKTSLKHLQRLVPKNSPAWEQSRKVAMDALKGKSKSPVGRAEYFHNKQVKPKWRKGMQKVAEIHNHAFYVALN